MKFSFLFVLIFVLFNGCALFQHTTSSNDETEQLFKSKTDLNVSNTLDKTTQSNSLLIKKDSNNRQYTVQIWPVGAFTYSSAAGFNGTAEKILMSGRDLEVVNSSSLSHIKQQEQSALKAQLKQNKVNKNKHTKSTKESSPSWKWVIAGSILLVLIIWRWRK